MNRMALLVLVILGTAAADVRAQDREISLEANPFHGTLGYGWVKSPALTAGVQFGFGFPQIDRTLVPDDESFQDIMHVGVFVRGRPTSSIALDGRIQFGFAELRGCSGCLPGLFTGASAGVFWGGRRVKIGSRITAGVINEHIGPAAIVVNFTPVALLLTHPM